MTDPRALDLAAKHEAMDLLREQPALSPRFLSLTQRYDGGPIDWPALLTDLLAECATNAG